VDVSVVRREIEAAVRHESETGTLRSIIERALAKAGSGGEARAAEEGVAAIRSFVEGAPTVIEATIHAAEEAGVVEQVRPIFETALSYMHESGDFIPDSLGLAGMLDDAYLIYGLMQEISERHRILTGKSLLPSGVFGQMPEIKRLIGDPTATRLDVAIVAFARRQNVKETIEQILGRIGGRGLTMDLPANVRMPTERSALSALPCLELGSLPG